MKFYQKSISLPSSNPCFVSTNYQLNYEAHTSKLKKGICIPSNPIKKYNEQYCLIEWAIERHANKKSFWCTGVEVKIFHQSPFIK